MCYAAQRCVAVGFFDGVHVGHQALLRGATSVITFRNHPLTVLSPDRAPCLLMSPEDRCEAIRECGVREITMLDFTDDLSRETPEQFLLRLGPCVRCGENWRFGAKGAGDAAFLRAHGVSVTVVPYARYRDEIVSSTRIRHVLEAGDIADANAMLGRPFALKGCVFRGKGEGVHLGFPTINLNIDQPVCLPRGVYAVSCGGRLAVADYGVAPTMGARAWEAPCLEIHYLDEGPVSSEVGGMTKVEFRAYLRPERRFDSLPALTRQIRLDCDAAKAVMPC